jgi:uncharacterized iron-regulated protein
MNMLFSVLLYLGMSNTPATENRPAYVIYDKEGKEVEFTQLIKGVSSAEAVFIGELHNNPISHWIQLQITRELASIHKNQVVLGAEMFESDNQLIMDEYLKGSISTDSYMKEMRLWPNYETDYAPLVEFAKAQNIPFIATNIPRRYASIVFKKGFAGLDSLNAEAKKYIAPLPVVYDGEVACYKRMLEMAGGHGGENLPKAQAIKDATMAHFIHVNLPEKKTFIHCNGAYHSDDHEGIVWYLKQYRKGIKIRTVTTVLQEDITRLTEENLGKADYIICVPADMITTH